MQLLVTRPQHQLAGTVAALEEDGHQVTVSPMLQRHFLDLPQPTGDFDILVLTSRNGVDALERQWPRSGREDWPVFAVGDATADAAAKAGFSRTVSCAGAVTDLVAKVSQACADGLIADKLGKPVILYPCALQPAHDLPALFLGHDLQCSAWPVYAMEDAAEFSPEASAALSGAAIDGVLLYSARSARTFANLFSSLDSPPEPPVLFALSQNICAALPPFLASCCQAAAEPNEAALRLLLSQHNADKAGDIALE